MALWAMLVGYCTFLAVYKAIIINNYFYPSQFTLSVLGGAVVTLVTFLLTIPNGFSVQAVKANFALTGTILACVAMFYLQFVIGIHLFHIGHYTKEMITSVHVYFGIATIGATTLFVGSCLGPVLLALCDHFRLDEDRFFEFKV